MLERLGGLGWPTASLQIYQFLPPPLLPFEVFSGENIYLTSVISLLKSLGFRD